MANKRKLKVEDAVRKELYKRKYQAFYNMIAKKIVMNISEAVKKQNLSDSHLASDEYVDKLVLKGITKAVDWHIEVAYESMAKGKDPFPKGRY